ncbi:MAG: hypothetical protein AMJ90_05635 [candidate division Zixibacteria bacterium SM23_73_2]|nr:MAG: hypothetical protein AMJ90_05635 [candidate division Zixibacteria bacterium SM23_73_2]
MKWRSTVTVNASWMMPNIFRIDTKFTEDAKLKEFEFRRETLKHSTILGIVSLSLTIVFSSYSQPRCCVTSLPTGGRSVSMSRIPLATMQRSTSHAAGWLNHFTKPGYGRADIYWVDARIIDELRPKQ